MRPTKCNICQSDKPLKEMRAIKSPHNQYFYTLYECKLCGSQQFYLFEHETTDQEKFYDSLAVNRGYELIPFKPSAYWKHQVKFINRIKKSGVSSVLDIGCKTGDFLLHWPGYIAREGIEISSTSARVARERGVTVYQSQIEKIQNLKKYDVVSCFAVLEHIEDPIEFLEKVINIVNCCGILVIMIPSFQTFKSKLLCHLKITWHMYSPPEHLNFFSREFLDDFFTRNGFTLVARRYSSGGMFNPIYRIPLAGKAFDRAMKWIDYSTCVSWLPIFDHMYSYYLRENA